MNILDLLTNDAKYLLASMYKIYIDRRKNGETKEKAAYFDDVLFIHETIMSKWKFEDVEYTCLELKKHDLIEGILADDTIVTVNLSTEAIALMEKTFFDKVDDVLGFLAKVKDAIPFA